MIQSNNLVINSDLSEVKVLANHFRMFCSDNQLNEDFSGVLELALVEAVNNIVIHAYENILGFKISAQFKIIDSEIIITLVDTGKTYKDEKISENKLKSSLQNQTDVETKDLAEGRWGLGLIHSIADEINRHRENGSNILTIKKSINS